jgi:hypothetical protein
LSSEEFLILTQHQEKATAFRQHTKEELLSERGRGVLPAMKNNASAEQNKIPAPSIGRLSLSAGELLTDSEKRLRSPLKKAFSSSVFTTSQFELLNRNANEIVNLMNQFHQLIAELDKGRFHFNPCVLLSCVNMLSFRFFFFFFGFLQEISCEEENLAYCETEIAKVQQRKGALEKRIGSNQQLLQTATQRLNPLKQQYAALTKEMNRSLKRSSI